MNNEEKILELLSQMQEQISSLEKKMDNNHVEVLNELHEIKEQIHEIDTKNATNHIATNTKLDKISEDLDFLTHKELQTEKELFNLKKKIAK